MKKFFLHIVLLISLIFLLSSCNPNIEKSASQTIIYGTTALLSFVLAIGCVFSVRKKNPWFIVMSSAITVVNVGYFCLACSSSLNEALISNRIAYLGQVALPFSMLMIILKITNTHYKKRLPYCLLGLSAIIFFIVASAPYLDVYYKEVAFEIINGSGKLIKVYGVLHSFYLIYLLGYFFAMVAVIIRAWSNKTVDSTLHAAIIAISVFVNIGVWLAEQFVSIDFEILSISYVISELFLLGVQLIAAENQRLKTIIDQKDETAVAKKIKCDTEDNQASCQNSIKNEDVFIKGVETLTAKETELFKAYVAGISTKDIMVQMNITENTLKYHSRNLYGKLGVTSRKQMVAIYNQLRTRGAIILENSNTEDRQ